MTVLAMAVPFLIVCAAWPAHAAWFEVCRGLNLAETAMAPLVVPKGSLFRDNGRADDPLADFTGDKWVLRLETILPLTLPPLDQCARVPVRITSNSAVKSVSASDNRRFVYHGSADILDDRLPSEDLLILRGRVLDSVP